MSDSSPGAVPAGAFSRRALLAAAVAGTAGLAVGCTASGEDGSEAVTPAEADQLAGQVTVQAVLVEAYDRVLAASPELAIEAAVLAEQARAQLERLRAAAPDAPGSARTPSSAPASAPAQPVVPTDPAGARAYLRGEVTRAAAAHAAACPDSSGARAALLGSISAGLRGAERQLA